VTFTCSANGTITATSRDRAAGIEQGITIQNAGGLSDADIERMKQEAERNKESDLKKQEYLKTQEKARKIISTAEEGIKAFDDATRQIFASKVQGIHQLITELQKTINTPNSKNLEQQLKVLEEECSKLFTESYNMKAARTKSP